MLRYTVAGRVVEISYEVVAGHHVYRAPAYGLVVSALKKSDAWKAFNDKLVRTVTSSDRIPDAHH